MLRPRSLLLLAVAAATLLLACTGPGATGQPTPVLGPYAAARTGVASPVRADPAVQDTHAGAAILRDTRHMCDLHGGRGSC
jgi:hypothetical protein